MDSEQFNVTFDDGHLSCVGSDATSIPQHIIQQYSSTTIHLDLSFNMINCLDSLESFTEVQQLILDNNELTDDLAFPHLPHLHTLSLNKNHISHLDILMKKLSSFMRLKYLSLHGNPVCPDQLCNTEKDADDYRRYRYSVLYHLPNLKFLDSTPVKDSELEASRRMGPYLQPVAAIQDTSVEQKSPPRSYAPLPQMRGGTGQHNDGLPSPRALPASTKMSVQPSDEGVVGEPETESESEEKLQKEKVTENLNSESLSSSPPLKTEIPSQSETTELPTLTSQPQDLTKCQTKVDLLLKATGDAPIMKRKKWLVEKVKKIGWVIEFVKRYIKCEPSESLFLYVNQSFAPSPDTDIGTLYDCFGSDGRLVLHYCKTQAWG